MSFSHLDSSLVDAWQALSGCGKKWNFIVRRLWWW